MRPGVGTPGCSSFFGFPDIFPFLEGVDFHYLRWDYQSYLFLEHHHSSPGLGPDLGNRDHPGLVPFDFLHLFDFGCHLGDSHCCYWQLKLSASFG